MPYSNSHYSHCGYLPTYMIKSYLIYILVAFDPLNIWRLELRTCKSLCPLLCRICRLVPLFSTKECPKPQLFNHPVNRVHDAVVDGALWGRCAALEVPRIPACRMTEVLKVRALVDGNSKRVEVGLEVGARPCVKGGILGCVGRLDHVRGCRCKV